MILCICWWNTGFPKLTADNSSFPFSFCFLKSLQSFLLSLIKKFCTMRSLLSSFLGRARRVPMRRESLAPFLAKPGLYLGSQVWKLPFLAACRVQQQALSASYEAESTFLSPPLKDFTPRIFSFALPVWIFIMTILLYFSASGKAHYLAVMPFTSITTIKMSSGPLFPMPFQYLLNTSFLLVISTLSLSFCLAPFSASQGKKKKKKLCLREWDGFVVKVN